MLIPANIAILLWKQFYCQDEKQNLNSKKKNIRAPASQRFEHAGIISPHFINKLST
jgi:hypothetical protein